MEDKNHIIREKAYIACRSYALLFMAIGTGITLWLIGQYISRVYLGGSWFVSFIVSNGIVFIGAASIDWTFTNSLSSISDVGKKKVKKNEEGEIIEEEKVSTSKAAVRLAIGTCIATLTLSVVSALFISDELAGESHLVGYNEQLKKEINIDNQRKDKAIEILSNSETAQPEKVAEAVANKEALLSTVLKKSQGNWAELYERDKNNPKAYFWKCRRCGSDFKNFREQVSKAIENGDKGIADASNYYSTQKDIYSTVLKTNVGANDAMATIKENVAILEGERNTKKGNFRFILVAFTFGCAGISWLLTGAIKEHREQYGKFVEEDYNGFFFAVSGFFVKAAELVADLLYSMTFFITDAMKKKGYIQSYVNVNGELITGLPYSEKEALKKKRSKGAKSYETLTKRDVSLDGERIVRHKIKRYKKSEEKELRGNIRSRKSRLRKMVENGADSETIDRQKSAIDGLEKQLERITK